MSVDFHMADELSSSQDPVIEIVRAIALPKEYGDGFRIASEGSGMPSSVTKATTEYDLSNWFTGGGPANQYLNDAETMFFIFQNAVRGLVYLSRAANLAAYRYLVTQIGEPLNQTFKCPLGSTPLKFGTAIDDPTILNHWAPHGETLPPGYDEAGNLYLWVDNDGVNAASMTVTTSVVLLVASVEFFMWDGKHPRRVGEVVNAAGGIFTQAAPVGGAYMFAVVHNFDPLNVAATCTVKIQSAPGAGSWAHRPAVPLFSPTIAINATRTNANAVKFENRSVEQEKNGSIASATVDPAIPWTNLTTGYDALTSLASYVTIAADDGYYGHTTSDDDDDMSDFYNDICPGVDNTNKYSTIGVFPLQERGPYKAVCAQIPINTGRNFFLEQTAIVEYQTVDKLPEQGFTRYTPLEIGQAIKVLRSMPSDWPNATHYTNILGSIGSLGRKGLDILAKYTTKPLAKVFPAAGAGTGLVEKVTIPMMRYGLQWASEYAKENDDNYRRQQGIRGGYSGV